MSCRQCLHEKLNNGRVSASRSQCLELLVHISTWQGRKIVGDGNNIT